MSYSPGPGEIRRMANEAEESSDSGGDSSSSSDSSDIDDVMSGGNYGGDYGDDDTDYSDSGPQSGTGYYDDDDDDSGGGGGGGSAGGNGDSGGGSDGIDDVMSGGDYGGGGTQDTSDQPMGGGTGAPGRDTADGADTTPAEPTDQPDSRYSPGPGEIQQMANEAERESAFGSIGVPMRDRRPGGVSQDQAGGVETGGSDLAAQARALESRVVRQSAQAEGPGDVTVTETEGGTLRARLTQSRRQELREGAVTLAEIEAGQQVAQQIEEETGTQVNESDVDVDIDRPGSSTEALNRRRQGEDLVQAEVTVSDDVQQTTQADVSVNEEQPGRRDRDIFSGIVSGTEDVLSVPAQVASGDPETRVEFRGEGSVVNVAADESPDLTADLGPVSDVGDALSDVGRGISQEFITPTSQFIGDVADVAQTGAQFTLGGPASNPRQMDAAAENQGEITTEHAEQEYRDVARGEEQDVTSESKLERFSEGAAAGGLGIANIPAIGGTAVDATEFGVEAGSETLQGGGGEFAQEAGGQAAVAGARTTETAVENPARFSGQIAGGLVTSSAGIGAARALGGARAARAASFGIQPGEELALAAARRGIPGASRVASGVSDVDVRGRARELAAEERATGQFQFRTRGGGDTETTEITAEDISPDRPPITPAEERTDVTGFERRRQQRERAEEGGMTDEERFQPERGQTMMERRAQRRREQAQEPEVTEGEAQFGTVEDLAPVLRTEVGTGAQDRLAEPSQPQAQEQDTATRPLLDTDIGTEIGTDRLQGLRSETRTEPRQETGQETRTETRTETRQETSQETRTELRTEQRTEVGAETRLEALSESRTEFDLPEDDEGRERGDDEAGGGGLVSREFTNPVASPEQFDEIEASIEESLDLEEF